MKVFKMTWMFIAMFCVCGLTTSCSSDDDDDDDDSYYEDVDEEWYESVNKNTYPNIVGRTFRFYKVGDVRGNQCSLDLWLTFTSATTYSIKKTSEYWYWKNGMYNKTNYEETKTGTYVRVGNDITMSGDEPFSYDDQWGNYEWNLTVTTYENNVYLDIEDQTDDFIEVRF